MEEVVAGPFRGYYVAAYACPVDPHGRDYVGYFKVFASRPDSCFDDTVCLLKGTQDEAVADPQEAMRLAVEGAESQLRSLPPADELAAFHEGRRFYFWERCFLGLSD